MAHLTIDTLLLSVATCQRCGRSLRVGCRCTDQERADFAQEYGEHLLSHPWKRSAAFWAGLPLSSLLALRAKDSPDRHWRLHHFLLQIGHMMLAPLVAMAMGLLSPMGLPLERAKPRQDYHRRRRPMRLCHLALAARILPSPRIS